MMAVQKTLEVGTRVVRLDGGVGYQGKKGTVVETTETRVRVLWDAYTYTNGTYYLPDHLVGSGSHVSSEHYLYREYEVTRPAKRTWVARKSVAAI